MHSRPTKYKCVKGEIIKTKCKSKNSKGLKPASSPFQHSELPGAPSVLCLGVPLAVCSGELLRQMLQIERSRFPSPAAQSYTTKTN